MTRRRIAGVVVGLTGPIAAVVMTTLYRHLSGPTQGVIYAGLVFTTAAGLWLILTPPPGRSAGPPPRGGRETSR